MTVLPSYKYGNPESIAISEENRTCKGCKHLTEWIAFGNKVSQCNKGRKNRNTKCYEETFGINCQGGK